LRIVPVSESIEEGKERCVPGCPAGRPSPARVDPATASGGTLEEPPGRKP
jgi:hypothetical protein